MPYGYVGDISTKIKQSKKNNGVLTINEVTDLQTDGSWGGSMEHIETQTLSGAVSTLSFDTLKEGKYSTHFITIENYVPDTNNRHLGLRFKVSGSADTANNYQYSMERITASTASQLYSGNDSKIWLAYNCGTGTGQSLNGSFYLYDAGSSSDTFMTQEFVMIDKDTNLSQNFGSGLNDVNQVVNGLEFMTSGDNLLSGTFKLFGIKDIT
tara:strand:+ start:508 stop:1137 length:630 start_codon:yes stop_codon:yes gene_type:complete